MEKSIKMSALTKIMTGVLVALLLVASMFLLAACGDKTDKPMSLSGKTMVSDYSKTEFNWAAGIDDQMKNEIKTGLASQDPAVSVFNVDGSAVIFGLMINDIPVYYTQQGSTIKFYTDADKTTEVVSSPEMRMEFTVGSNFLKVKYVTLGDLTNVPIIDYTLYFYAQV